MDDDEAAAAALDGKGGQRGSGLTYMGLKIPVFVLQTRQGQHVSSNQGKATTPLGIRGGGGGVPGDSWRRRWRAASLEQQIPRAGGRSAWSGG